MANTYSANVARFTSSATFVGQAYIGAIKYIGAVSGTASITDGTNTLWEQAGSANWEDQGLKIKCPGGFTVNISNSAVVYVYMK